MARIFYEDDFKDKIKNATKKIIGIGALSFALTACQTTGNDIQYPDSNLIQEKQEISSLQEKVKIEVVNEKTYKRIFNKARSGLYENPLNGEVQTISFYADNDSFDNITSDINNTGMEMDGYLCQLNALSGNLNKDKNSFIPLAANKSNCPENDDPGLIFLNNSISLGKFNNQYLGITKEQFAYFFYAHETIHKTPSSNLEENTLVVPFEKTLKEEIRADVGASIMMVQLLEKENIPSSKIESFLDKLMTARNQETLQSKGVSVKASDHLSTVGVSTVFEIYKEDPSFLLNIENKDLLKFSEIVSKTAMSYDFSNDFNKTVNKTPFKVDYTEIDEYLESSGLTKNGEVVPSNGMDIEASKKAVEEMREDEYKKQKFIHNELSTTRLSSQEAQSHIVKKDLKSFEGYQEQVKTELEKNGMSYEISDRSLALDSIRSNLGEEIEPTTGNKLINKSNRLQM